MPRRTGKQGRADLKVSVDEVSRKKVWNIVSDIEDVSDSEKTKFRSVLKEMSDERKKDD